MIERDFQDALDLDRLEELFCNPPGLIESTRKWFVTPAIDGSRGPSVRRLNIGLESVSPRVEDECELLVLLVHVEHVLK